MSKVTSKLQVTVPKSIAERFNIKPGDQIDWEAAGDTIRVVPAPKRMKPKTQIQDRLKHFDQATERQRQRETTLDPALLASSAREGRGWTRADLYDRGDAR
jgi:AbrB family looped-hinge helix DNA binding protein